MDPKEEKEEQGEGDTRGGPHPRRSPRSSEVPRRTEEHRRQGGDGGGLEAIWGVEGATGWERTQTPHVPPLQGQKPQTPCARAKGPVRTGARAHGTRAVGTGYPEDFDRKKLVGLWLNANSYQDPKEHSRLTSEHVAEEIQHY